MKLNEDCIIEILKYLSFGEILTIKKSEVIDIISENKLKKILGGMFYGFEEKEFPKLGYSDDFKSEVIFGKLRSYFRNETMPERNEQINNICDVKLINDIYQTNINREMMGQLFLLFSFKEIFNDYREEYFDRVPRLCCGQFLCFLKNIILI